MIVGRDRERTVLRNLVAAARQGNGGTVIVRGDAGIGKTALLDDLISDADVRTVRAGGYESEADLPFATLGDLLRPILDHLDDVPPLQADSLRTALGLGTSTGVDPASVEVATTSLVRTVAAREPLLVAIDDVQWVDTTSLNALMHLARRAAEMPVALVGAARPDELTPAIAALPSLQLDPLPRAQAEALVRAGAPLVVPSVMRAVVDAAQGNPLALHELLQGLSAQQLGGHLSIVDPIVVSAEVVLAYRRRIDELPAPTRRALLIAVADGRGLLDRVLDALRSASLDVHVFEPAEQRGLISFSGESVVFRHPLVRSAVYQTATPADRRAAHGLLAEVERDPDRRAWHLASSVTGPDPAVREALVDMAGRALARGADGSAASVLTRAAELTAEPIEKGRLYAKAARAANRGGELTVAAHLLALAEPLIADDPIDRADLTLLDADMRMRGGDFQGAYLDLASHAEAIASIDPRRAMTMLLVAAKLHVYRMEAALALRTVERALELSGGAALDVLQMSSLGMTQTMAGHPDGASTTRAAAQAGMSGKRGHLHTLSIAWPLVWVEDYELAERFISRSVQVQRDGGYHSFLPQSLLPGAELDYRIGQWARALARVIEARQLFVETNQPTDASLAAGMMARIEASLGAGADCAAHAAAAIDGDGVSGMRAATAFAEAALGHLALGERRFDAAIGHLRRAATIAADGGVVEPSLLPVHADLAESLTRAGRVAEGAEVIDELEHLATSCSRASARAAAARCRGLLAPVDSFSDMFDAALELHELTPTPFERARTELCFGERLRRANLRAKAREHLHVAFDLFQSLGARPWVALAAAELRASGETSRTGSTSTTELTAREQEVARRVANGATNKEVAIDLFVNAKTVEFHLGNVYRKLGVRSRSELARVFPRS